MEYGPPYAVVICGISMRPELFVDSLALLMLPLHTKSLPLLENLDTFIKNQYAVLETSYQYLNVYTLTIQVNLVLVVDITDTQPLCVLTVWLTV